MTHHNPPESPESSDPGPEVNGSNPPDGDAPIPEPSTNGASAVDSPASARWVTKLKHGLRAADENFIRVMREYPFLVGLGLMALTAELGYAILIVATLPIHIDFDLNAPEYYGWVLAAFLLVEAAFKSPFGALSDRIGRKPLMIFGPLWSSACCFAMYFLTRPWQFIVVQGLNGLGFAAFWPGCFTTIADRVRKKDITLAMSVFNLTYMLGLAFGPLAKTMVGNQDIRAQLFRRMLHERMRDADLRWRMLHPHHTFVHHVINEVGIATRLSLELAHAHEVRILELAARYGVTNQHRFPFLLVCGMLALPAILALFSMPSRKPGRERFEEENCSGSVFDGHTEGTGSILQNAAIGMKIIPWMMVIAFCIFTGIGFVSVCAEPYAIRVYNISERMFGVTLLPICGMIGALALPLGRLGDRWGATRSIRLGMGLCVLGLWLVAFQPLVARLPGLAWVGSMWIMTVLLAIVGIGTVIVNPAWLARVTQIAPEHLAGAALGAASMAQGMGALLGVLIGGELWAKYWRHFPEANVFGCAFFLTIGAAVAFWHVRDDVPGGAANAALNGSNNPVPTEPGASTPLWNGEH